MTPSLPPIRCGLVLVAELKGSRETPQVKGEKVKRPRPPPPTPVSIRGVDGRIFFWLSARHFPAIESHTTPPPSHAPRVLNRSIKNT
jgi:hypothetical protein